MYYVSLYYKNNIKIKRTLKFNKNRTENEWIVPKESILLLIIYLCIFISQHFFLYFVFAR